MTELRKLLDAVITSKYTDLLENTFDISYTKIGSHWAKFDEMPFDGYLIEIDEELKDADDAVKTGFIASVLSQIVRYRDAPLEGKYRYDTLEDCPEEDIIKNEIENDKETIRRGFRDDLYAAVKFLEGKNYWEDGFSGKELEELAGIR